MKDYKGVVFFDYDGTLIDEVDGIFELPDSAKEAIAKLRANGYATCICSGRTKQMSEAVKEYFDGYVTGAGAYCEIDEETVLSIEITPEEIEAMREICAKRNVVMLMDGESQSYCDGIGTKIYDFFRYVFNVQDHWVQPWETEGKCKINKLTFMYENPEDAEYVRESFENQLELAKHIRYTFTDATPKGVDKGTGIEAMISYMGLTKDDSYCFGDGDNDLPMVKVVGHPIIMGRHFAGLEPYAEFTTDLVKNDGIKKGLEHFGLI